jgi:hypothetical protein
MGKETFMSTGEIKKVMDRVPHHSLLVLYKVLSLILLLCASLAHTEERPESMDLTTLKARAVESQQRYDKNSSDDKSLRAISIVYYAAALKESKATSIKENHYER